MAFETIKITTLSGFARALEDKGMENLIFRGQADAKWHLMPTAYRKGVIDAPDYERRRAAEKRMLSEFQRQARPHLVDRPEGSKEWEWLALAQHYGLPTRFLDWTENAAAALFFAVESSNGGKASSVWCATRPAQIQHASPFDVDGIYLYEPPHIIPRITVQQACFTVHPADYDVKPYKWSGELFRINVAFKSREIIRQALRSIGVNRASLFPDPAGIAADLRRRFMASRITEQ